jgi:cell division protein FtsZ
MILIEVNLFEMPKIGEEAARETEAELKGALSGADMVFITCGMGGGTGTGATPVIAQVAKEMGILTVAVVTRPFPFEGKRRALIAEEGIKRLSQHVDSLIIIPNEKYNTVAIDVVRAVINQRLV